MTPTAPEAVFPRVNQSPPVTLQTSCGPTFPKLHQLLNILWLLVKITKCQIPLPTDIDPEAIPPGETVLIRTRLLCACRPPSARNLGGLHPLRRGNGRSGENVQFPRPCSPYTISITLYAVCCSYGPRNIPRNIPRNTPRNNVKIYVYALVLVSLYLPAFATTPAQCVTCCYRPHGPRQKRKSLSDLGLILPVVHPNNTHLQ